MAVALITGASRGIGLACAVELAKKGFDVALAARTLEEGQGRDNGDFYPGRPIEGSLASAASAVEAIGVKALPVHLDLLDAESVDTCVQRVVQEWGRIDVLVNNAHMHTGTNIRLAKLNRPIVEDFFRANVVGPLLLAINALPVMAAQGGGRIINVVSAAGLHDPTALPGEGGVGVLYGMGKAAQYRIPGFVNVEYGEAGILCFSMSPGFVKTAVIREMPIFKDAGGDISPSIPGSVVAWLATSDEAAQYVCQPLEAVELAQKHHLIDQ